MSEKSRENLKTIWFAGELLPKWAQLIDLAAGLCGLPEDARHWFSRFKTGGGVDDARTIIDHCSLLQQGIQEQRESLAAELRRGLGETQPAKIVGAWIYALDTMIHVARTSKTYSWMVEGAEDVMIEDGDGGDIELCRVRRDRFWLRFSPKLSKVYRLWAYDSFFSHLLLFFASSESGARCRLNRWLLPNSIMPLPIPVLWVIWR